MASASGAGNSSVEVESRTGMEPSGAVAGLLVCVSIDFLFSLRIQARRVYPAVPAGCSPSAREPPQLTAAGPAHCSGLVVLSWPLGHDSRGAGSRSSD